MKYLDFLQLFEDGGGEGGNAGGAGAGSGTQGNSGSNAGGASYSFEQAEEIANARADRASRAALANYFKQQGMTEEQVTQALADFRQKQQSQQPNVSQITQERDAAQKELADYKNRDTLRSKGVADSYMDFVLFKVGGMVSDKKSFDKAADEFLKANPQYKGGSYRVSTGTQGGGSGTSQNTNDLINNNIRNAFLK